MPHSCHTVYWPLGLSAAGFSEGRGTVTIQHDRATEESSWGRTYGGCHSLGDSSETLYNRSMSCDLPLGKG